MEAAFAQGAAALSALAPGGAPINSELALSPASGARARVTTRFAGSSTLVAGFSVDRFIAHHYEIESHGSGPREAAVEMRAGVVRIEPRGSEP